VDIGRKAIRIIERADPHEACPSTEPCVVTPHCHVAHWAAGNALALAARARSRDELYLTGEQLDPFGLDDCIQRKGGTRFSLTPPAVTAMDDERRRTQAIAYPTAGTAAAVKECVGSRHDGLRGAPMIGRARATETTIRKRSDRSS